MRGGSGGGHCILVTGERGTGKTTLVNQAIYNASLFGHGDLYIGKDKEETERSSIKKSSRIDKKSDALYDIFSEKKNEKESIIIAPNLDTINILIDIRITIANYIDIEKLMKRIIRKFYASLVEYGVAGLAPELIKEARWAYIRTYALEISDIESIKSSLELNLTGITSTKGLSAKLAMNAKEEIENAKKIISSLPQATLEDSEDNLIALLSKLDSQEFHTQDSMAERIEQVANTILSVFSKFKQEEGKLLHGLPNISTNVVFVFDELDKLSVNPENKREEAETDTSLAKNISEVVAGLKHILTSGKASFIFVSDKESAVDWQHERYKSSSKQILRTIFSDHIHLSHLSISSAAKILKFHTKEAGETEEANVLAEAIEKFKTLQKDGGWTTEQNEDIETFLAYSFTWSSNGNIKDFLLSIRNFVKQFSLNYQKEYIALYFEKIHIDFLKGVILNHQLQESCLLQLMAMDESNKTSIKRILQSYWWDIWERKETIEKKQASKEKTEGEKSTISLLSDSMAKTIIETLYEDKQAKKATQATQATPSTEDKALYLKDRWAFQEYETEISVSIEKHLTQLIRIENVVYAYKKTKKKNSTKRELFQKEYKGLLDTLLKESS